MVLDGCMLCCSFVTSTGGMWRFDRGGGSEFHTVVVASGGNAVVGRQGPAKHQYSHYMALVPTHLPPCVRGQPAACRPIVIRIDPGDEGSRAYTANIVIIRLVTGSVRQYYSPKHHR